MASSVPAQKFFERREPVLFILGAFFLLGLPLCLVGATRPWLLDRSHLGTLYFILVGNTHFLLTFALYFQSQNLSYFRSTNSRVLLYIAIPIFIFAFFDIYRTLNIATLYPTFDRGFVIAVRLFNFYHFGRQSFGVLQLFKRRAGAVSGVWGRRVENGFFFTLVALMLVTFLNNGELALHSPVTLGLAGLAASFFVTALIALVRSGAGGLGIAYFIAQSVSGGFAIFRTYLYPFALAVHYVEYHVLMFPRCFETPLGSQPVDKVWGTLRESKLVFYTLLVFGAVVVSLMMATAGRQWSPGTTMALSLFDGLFVFHFFVESLVWRFSEPYYRQTTLPLFFSARVPAGQFAGASR